MNNHKAIQLGKDAGQLVSSSLFKHISEEVVRDAFLEFQSSNDIEEWKQIKREMDGFVEFEGRLRSIVADGNIAQQDDEDRK